MMDVYIFSVDLGQCLYFYPHLDPSYGMMVDCGSKGNFHPIDHLIQHNMLPRDGYSHLIGNWTLTNYDEDHYSGLPYLLSKAEISTARLAKNLTAQELWAMKEIKTNALKAVIELMDGYVVPVAPGNYSPPYTKKCFYLEKHQFPYGWTVNTNDLSQMVFVQYHDFVICIPGDLEKRSWEIMLRDLQVQEWLKKTTVFIASHHGRESGYHPDIFAFCKPDCVVISDKSIIHDTQNTTGLYAAKVSANGIALNGNVLNRRRVLSTRKDGHIKISVSSFGGTNYETF